MTAGSQNTKLLLKKIKAYIDKEKIETVIVATNTGETGAEVAKAFQGKNTIAVTHCYRFKQSRKFELKNKFKKEILANKAKIITATHALSSAERRYSQKIRHT
jgi:hypothetical protein